MIGYTWKTLLLLYERSNITAYTEFVRLSENEIFETCEFRLQPCLVLKDP